MTINERIKFLRNKLNLNQVDFASKIGIGQAAISAIEKGIRSVTEQTIMLICREFNVNENWLRNNKGEIFNIQNHFSIDEYAKNHQASDLDIEIVKIYLSLDKEVRQNIMFKLKNAILAQELNEKKVIDIVPARGGTYEIERTNERIESIKKDRQKEHKHNPNDF